jgi:Fic/DOC family
LLRRRASLPRPIPETNPAGRLIFSDPAKAASLTRQVKGGRAIRLASGIFAVGSTLPIAAVARHHLWEIIAHVWPGAVICDRGALAGGIADGWVFLCHPDPPRHSDLELPGITITCRIGPGPLPADMPFVSGLTLSGPARRLIENMPTAGRPAAGRPPRAAGDGPVGDAIDLLASSGDGTMVQTTLNQLEQIAAQFPPRAVLRTKQLLVAALGTASGTPIASRRLAARVSGEPFDAARIALFTKLRDTLDQLAPRTRPVLGDPATRTWLPFFEAYFSNYIEGTEFSIDEARDIAVAGVVPKDRPADAHDVSATYAIVNDPSLMTQTANTAGEFLDLLTERHATLMAARPEKNPGTFKTRPNYAGGTAFVSPTQLVGTLRAGWGILHAIVDPFHRALMTMFLVTECHPFDDGNGRLARIVTNAELVAAGEVRIIIPTSYRGNYLAALTGATHNAAAQALASVLDFSRQWVAAVDWTDWDGTVRQLNASHAFTDSAVAELSGNGLRLPPPV